MKLNLGMIVGMVLLLSLGVQAAMAADDETVAIDETAAQLDLLMGGCPNCPPTDLCGNNAPNLFPSGVASGTSVTLKGPAGDYTWSWKVVSHKTKSSVETIKTALTKDVTFTVPADSERIDAFLVVSAKDDESCQIKLCDFFWVTYPCPLTPAKFCEDKRVDKTYNYVGPIGDMNVLYTVKNAANILKESSTNDPFTAHFTNAVTYPAGKYTVNFAIKPWNGYGTAAIVSCDAEVNIVPLPTGSITL